MLFLSLIISIPFVNLITLEIISQILMPSASGLATVRSTTRWLNPSPFLSFKIPKCLPSLQNYKSTLQERNFQMRPLSFLWVCRFSSWLLMVRAFVLSIFSKFKIISVFSTLGGFNLGFRKIFEDPLHPFPPKLEILWYLRACLCGGPEGKNSTLPWDVPKWQSRVLKGGKPCVPWCQSRVPLGSQLVH